MENSVPAPYSVRKFFILFPFFSVLLALGVYCSPFTAFADWGYVDEEHKIVIREPLHDEYLYWGGVLSVMNDSLSNDQVYRIGKAVVNYGREHGISPRLIVAIIKVESNGRLDAVSPMGARGLMQVMPWWPKKLGVEEDLFSIDSNIRIGTYILSDNIKKWGYKEGILRYYRGSLPTDDSYFHKVERALESIPQVRRS